MIAARSEGDLNNVVRQLPEVFHKYNWTFYKTPEDPECSGCSFEIIKSDFEFLNNANELLVVRGL